ncbi:hypothetical protein FD20_GL002215 [Liquorilactobacillus uvarum DSM 19971]|uniref:Uncharacterized protein n=1 Tax=Liquorilactobacillus uvarum DSM 19971 TaxID=1423812 RepID=A0A0R1PXJ4_9LACO|nr:hypothetical protein FD20_GL002215 [Liquorilactobacillus uvarum DSM 19971]
MHLHKIFYALNEIDSIEKNGENVFYNKWYESKVGKGARIDFPSLTNSQKNAYQAIEDNYNALNESYEVRCLYHDLKRDSGYFAEIINFRDLIHPFFVEPIFNNPRLRAQSGFFLFEPYNGLTKDISEISRDIKNLGLGNIYIPKKYKRNILSELDYFCEINKATLFPDAENVANYVAMDFNKPFLNMRK